MRDDLNARAQRRIAVLDPVKLVIDNYPEGRAEELRSRPTIRSGPSSAGARCRSRASCGSSATTSPRTPPKGYFRLTPGAEVRLRYAYIVQVHRRREGRRAATSPSSIAPTTRPRAAARRAPTRARSRATSTGSPSTHAVPARGAALRSAVPRAVSRRAQSARRARGDGEAAARAAARARAPSSPATTTRTPSRSSATTSTTSIPASKRVITAYVEPALAAAPRRGALPVRAPRLLRRRPRATTRPASPCSTAR